MDNKYFISTFGIRKPTLQYDNSVPGVIRDRKKTIIYKGNAQGYVGEATYMPVQSFMLIIPSSE